MDDPTPTPAARLAELEAELARDPARTAAWAGLVEHALRLGDPARGLARVRDALARAGAPPGAVEEYLRLVRRAGLGVGDLGLQYPRSILLHALSPDQARLALGLAGGAVEVLETRHGCRVAGFELPSGAELLAWAGPPGRLLACCRDPAGRGDQQVLVLAEWSPDRGAGTREYPLGPGHGARPVAVDPTGSTLVVGGTEPRAGLLELGSGELRTLAPPPPSHDLKAAWFSPDGRRVLLRREPPPAPGNPGWAGFRLVERASLGTREVPLFTAEPVVFHWSPDGRWLAAAYAEPELQADPPSDRLVSTLRLFDLARGAWAHQFTVGRVADRVAWEPPGHLAALGLTWDLGSGDVVAAAPAGPDPEPPGLAVRVDPGSRTSFRIVATPGEGAVAAPLVHSQPILALEGATGRPLALATDASLTGAVWDLENGLPLLVRSGPGLWRLAAGGLRLYEFREPRIRALALGADPGAEEWRSPEHLDLPRAWTAAAVAPDEDRVAVGTAAGEVAVLLHGRTEIRFPLGGRIRDLVFLPGGVLVAAVEQGTGSIRFLLLEKGLYGASYPLDAPATAAGLVAGPGGRMVVSAATGPALMWTTGQEVPFRLPAPRRFPGGRVAVSPDGAELAYGWSDGGSTHRIGVVDAADGRVLAGLPDGLAPDLGPVAALAYAAGGRWLVFAQGCHLGLLARPGA